MAILSMLIKRIIPIIMIWKPTIIETLILHLRLKHGYSAYSDQKNYSHNYDLEAYHCSEFDIAIDELYYLELVVSLKSPPCFSLSASQRSYPPASSLGPVIFYLGFAS